MFAIAFSSSGSILESVGSCWGGSLALEARQSPRPRPLPFLPRPRPLPWPSCSFRFSAAFVPLLTFCLASSKRKRAAACFKALNAHYNRMLLRAGSTLRCAATMSALSGPSMSSIPSAIWDARPAGSCGGTFCTVTFSSCASLRVRGNLWI